MNIASALRTIGYLTALLPRTLGTLLGIEPPEPPPPYTYVIENIAMKDADAENLRRMLRDALVADLPRSAATISSESKCATLDCDLIRVNELSDRRIELALWSPSPARSHSPMPAFSCPLADEVRRRRWIISNIADLVQAHHTLVHRGAH
jgi:hypothetical protein